MYLGTPFSALPPAQCFLLSSLPSTFTGSSSYQYDLHGGVREREWLVGGRQWSAFPSPIPAGEGEQRLMGGRRHGRVQEWVSLDEGQDIIREVLRRGEQCSYTYSCTGSWPGGHKGRGSLRTGSWGLVRLCDHQLPTAPKHDW